MKNEHWRQWVSRWWLLPIALGGSLVVQKLVFESRYDVAGHAAEHLGSATAPFMAVALIVILLWSTPSALRQPDVLLACGAWLVANFLVLVGNVRVVDALIRAGIGQIPIEQLVESPAIASAHGLANLAPWFGLVAALALTAVLWRRRHVSTRVAVAAAVVSLVVPPWIIPGAGVIVSVFAMTLTQRGTIPSTDPP
ncbi:MAG: hypothetical protein ACRDGO_02120 [Actinomycetota bacterium]